jgi:hypothetical protein
MLVVAGIRKKPKSVTSLKMTGRLREKKNVERVRNSEDGTCWVRQTQE